MADEKTLARFRRVTALEETDTIYTDSVIDGMIEDLTFDAAVATVWKEKAAAAAGLVDITESGSSRQLSQLRKSYLEMSTAVGPAEETAAGSGSFVVRIERV